MGLNVHIIASYAQPAMAQAASVAYELGPRAKAADSRPSTSGKHVGMW